jgi:hypothetical protein
MTITASLTASPASLPAGSVLTVTYAVQGDSPGTGQVISFSGTVTVGGTSYPGSTGSFTLPAAATAATAAAAASVSYAMPACPGLAFAKTSNPAAFAATVPAAAKAGKVTVSGSVTVGSAAPIAVSAPVTITAAPVTPTPPPASGTAPYPAALASGHTLLEQYLPDDLYAWRFQPGTTTPVTNGSGVSEDPSSPRNVAVTTGGDLLVLQLATTSTEDCGVIQSPGQYPTSSGVVETLIRFSGFTSGGSTVFADWASFWMYNVASWPGGGEIDAVETQYGNSYVSYHYTPTTSASSDTATTGPWAYTGKTVQLSPVNTTTAPVAPNIVPDEWTYVTLAFGRAAGGGYYCDVYYNGVLYCTISGAFVTGGPMCITAGTGFGAATLGANQAPYDQAGTVELQYVRVFS